MTTITKTGHYRYRNGEPATVLTVEKPGEYPVVTNDPRGRIYLHDGIGMCPMNSKYDLIPIPRKGWLNLYRRNFNAQHFNDLYGCLYDSKEEADSCAGTDRLACVEIELPEGET